MSERPEARGGRLRDRGASPYGTADGSTEVVSASEAAKNMGTLLDRVRSGGVDIVIERHGTPIARLSAVEPARSCTPARFVEVLRALPPLDADFREAVRSGVDEMNQPLPIGAPWES